MNDTELRDLFDSAVARPDVDRIDTDAVLLGGRRRRRLRAGTTVVAVAAVVLVAGSLVVGGTRQSVGIAGSSAPGVPSPVEVSRADQLAGSWILSSISGRDVAGPRVRDGRRLAVVFGPPGQPSTWELTGSCRREHGRYAVDAGGAFSATYIGPAADATCPTSADPLVEQTIGALTSAVSATLTGRSATAARLTMRDGSGAVLAEWLAEMSQPTADAVASPATCRDAVLRPGGTVADQEAVDATADRVRQLAASQPTDSLSVLVVHPDARSVDVFWVGRVPTALTDLVAVEAERGVSTMVIPARYTRAQMIAAGERAIRVAPPADDPASRGLTIGSASACNDGSGVKVTIAVAQTGLPAAAVPPAYAAAIQAAAGDVRVVAVPGPRPVESVPKA